MVQPAGRQRGVEGQRLTHTRAGSDDDHLTGMQPVGELVEVGEARRDAQRDTAPRRDGVDLVHRRLQEILERDVVLRGALLGDLVHLGLGAVDHLGDILPVGTGVAVLDDAGAGLHQPTQQRLLRDDLGVVAGVGRGGHRGDQRVQVRRTTDALELSCPLEFRGDRHRVGGLAFRVQGEDRLEDRLMGRTVEVAGADLLDDVGDRVLGQQHATEHRLLGGEVLRGLPTEVLGRDLVFPASPSGGGAAPAVIHNSHACQTSRNVRSHPTSNEYDPESGVGPGRPRRESPVSTSCSGQSLPIGWHRQ